jgi:acyl-CoA synthetase (AMP-forming)/AMP-acid ligase II
MDILARVQGEMPSLERTILVPYLDDAPDPRRLEGAMTWDALLAEGRDAELQFEELPFEHPLWVLYSSGTTGMPKPIVHSQGGILLEHLKKMHLHVDGQAGDRMCPGCPSTRTRPRRPRASSSAWSSCERDARRTSAGCDWWSSRSAAWQSCRRPPARLVTRSRS